MPDEMPDHPPEGFHFDKASIDMLAALAVERWGPALEPYFDEIRRSTANWSDDQFLAAEQAGIDTEQRMLELLHAGVSPDDPLVYPVLDDDLDATDNLIPLHPVEYRKLGQAFTTVPELRARLDARDPDLADYMRNAIVAYTSSPERTWRDGTRWTAR